MLYRTFTLLRKRYIPEKTSIVESNSARKESEMSTGLEVQLRAAAQVFAPLVVLCVVAAATGGGFFISLLFELPMAGSLLIGCVSGIVTALGLFWLWLQSRRTPTDIVD